MRQGIRAGVMLPNVHRVKRGGKVFKYHRHTRAPLPTDVPEEHPRFVAAWSAQEALGASPAPRKAQAPAGTIAAGCAAYLASRSYTGLSDGYRPVIRRHVEAIRVKAGTARMADLRQRHIAADLEPLTPAVARSRLKAWRKLVPFWAVAGWVQEDVTQGVKAPRPRTDGFTAWTDDDVAAFRASWPVGSAQRLALELLAWTGARASDVVRLGPGMVRGGVLEFRQVKTGSPALVPWPGPDLAPCIAGCRDMVYLTTIHGRPRSPKAFSGWFSGAATEAALPGLSAHGLRKYRMNRLAEDGASVLKMQAWVGHTTLDEVEHYTRAASRRAAVLGAEQERNGVKS